MQCILEMVSAQLAEGSTPVPLFVHIPAMSLLLSHQWLSDIHPEEPPSVIKAKIPQNVGDSRRLYVYN